MKIIFWIQSPEDRISISHGVFIDSPTNDRLVNDGKYSQITLAECFSNSNIPIASGWLSTASPEVIMEKAFLAKECNFFQTYDISRNMKVYQYFYVLGLAK